MEKVYEDVGVCPSCGKKTFHVQLFRYELPVEGPSLLFVGLCESCGARAVDVIPLETSGEKTLEFELNEESMRKIIYLPGDTEIILPEAGIEVRLTPAFKGRITTLEGVINILIEDLPTEARRTVESLIKSGKARKLIIRNKSGLLREIQPRALS